MASKPVLWLTEHPFQIGMRTSALGKPFAELQAINLRPDDMDYAICVPEVGQTASKTSLSKKLLLAPVPTDLLQNSRRVNNITSLQTFWLSTDLAVRTTRHEHVLACVGMFGII